MKVKDLSQWQQQQSDFANDSDPMSEIVNNFMTHWCDNAELILAKHVERGGTNPNPMEALRSTLRITEDGEGGKLQIGYLGMVLVLITTHWESAGDPNTFFEMMTPIEQNLYADVAALKLISMELEAQNSAQSAVD